MHRLIMLSATYRQASEGDIVEPQATNAADLYARFSRRRLSAEEIRDSILAISGELDRVPGTEHPFTAPTSWSYTQHTPFTAVFEHNKRSVYLMVQRLKRHPFLTLFDGADPNATTAERLATTVPTQALFFLNDPFVHAKADAYATRLQAAGSNDLQRIILVWRAMFGRAPNSSEDDEAIEFLRVYRLELAASGQDNVDVRGLAAYIRALFGGNEFLHLD